MRINEKIDNFDGYYFILASVAQFQHRQYFKMEHRLIISEILLWQTKIQFQCRNLKRG